jgi:hypothetical protein
MAKNRVERGHFSKVSTGEFPVFFRPVDNLNRSGPVRLRSGRTDSSSESVYYRMGSPRQTAVSDLPKVIPCPMAPSFKHSTLVVCAEQLNYSAIAAGEGDGVGGRIDG